MDQATAIRQLLCPKQQWINDKDVTKCKACQRVFVPLFVWKHHCRFCGCVFCNNCAANILAGESINYDSQKRLRHCDPCHQRIQLVLKRQSKDIRRQSNLFNPDQTVIMIQIDDPDSNQFTHQRQTHQNLRDLMSQNKLALEHKALIILKDLAEQLCDKFGLQSSTWKLRLAEIAWQAVVQTKPQIFIRKQPWSLNQQIRVLTILAPTEAVAAVCVRGLILQRNIPSKQFETHMRYPRIVTIRSAIEAQSLVQNNQVRFDEMVRNEGIILRGCLQKVFGLSPNIMFVQQNVSKGALQLAQQRNIMIISKVKSNDLQKIERLAMIKKRIDNLLAVDRYQPGDMIGCCEKVYFKTVRSGEMLMFIQHEAGIRTILLGDTTESSNQNLKKVMDLLLKMAWNLKMERELVVRDVRIGGDVQSELSSALLTSYQQKKYVNLQAFIQSQDILTTKITYSVVPVQATSKAFQQYLKIRGGRKILLQICGKTQIFTNKLYCGEEMSVGTFIMKCALQGVAGCRRCNSQHLIRFYLNSFNINVKIEVESTKKPIRLSPVEDEEEQEAQKNVKPFEQRQNLKLHAAITQFLHTFRLQQRQSPSKLLFLMYFECLNCGKVLGNNRARIGNDFLLMSLHHFLLMITRTAQQNDKIVESSSKCEHSNIARVIQCPRARAKFSAKRVQKHILSDICFNEAIFKRLQTKDEAMVSQLFKKSLIEKMTCIQHLQMQMAKLPFSSGLTGMSFSTISISGASAHAHIFYQPFSKIQTVIEELRQTINMIELDKQIEEGMMDWTVLMRKFSKIDHVIKLAYQVVNFITNALKKLKIQQTFHSAEDILIMNSPNFQNSPIRKFSDARIETESIKTQSIASNGNLPTNFTQSMAYINPQASFISNRTTAIRKQTSFYIQTQFDAYMKKLRRHRFLRFQGAYLYYPIGNIEDPVSLLACCLNSDQFKQNLKEPIYKDNISLRISFYRQLKSDWPPYLEASKVYKQLTKEDASKGQSQQVGFSIFHHKQFEELRASEGIDFRLYIRSLYGCQSWDSSGGKSNSSFSKAHNETLVVKIINEKQFVQFQKFAQAYLKYMRYKREAKQPSYLAKIFGIYEVLIRNKVYKCVVMQNVFFGLDKIRQVYDLKGSEVNRLAQPVQDKSFTGLDTNFIIDKDGQPYLLEPNVFDKVSAALNQDALFLKDQGVIDYSLLVIESENTLRMAIIDFMRPYHFVEKIQTIYKQIKSGKDPTVIPPQQYAERFMQAMKRYFIKVN